MSYDRQAAVRYAHRWAFERNAEWGVFDEMGGDCTNFVSQCLFAGGRVMNYAPETGWFYIGLRQRAPAWTGVEELRRFLTGNKGPGPYGEALPLAFAQAGDVVFLELDQGRFSHAGIVVKAGASPNPENVLIAAHTRDCDNRPLIAYPYRRLALVHLWGVRDEAGQATNE